MTGNDSAGKYGTTRKIRPQFAGAWYDANPAILSKRIDADLGSAEAPPSDNVYALILPHAGYDFSGKVAAHGVNVVRGRLFKRVVILAPSHRIPLSQRIAMPDAAAVETPLGTLPIDRGALQQLGASRCFEILPEAFEGEHSIEIELPVLQRGLGDFSLVPLVVGRLDADNYLAAAHALQPLLDQDTLVVVSSDFTHYGSSFGFQPFGEPIADNIRRLDDGAFAEIAQLDGDGFLDYCRRTGATICGRDPIALLLEMLPGDAQAHRIVYTTSGHITGDFSHCVSYMAIAFSLPSGWPRQDATVSISGKSSDLSPTDRHMLLRLARRTIEFHLKHERLPTPTELAYSPTPATRQRRGVFVSLYLPGHQLRGCIGEIMPQRPLFEGVIHNALNAAFNDPRFPALHERELPDLSIEISALTPPHEVASPEQIIIGRHGIILEKDGRTAVFLPQVAVEQQWTREQTLSYLSQKAGLSPDAWQSHARLHVFEANVLNEGTC